VVSGAYFVSGIVDEGSETSTTSTSTANTSTSTSADEGRTTSTASNGEAPHPPYDHYGWLLSNSGFEEAAPDADADPLAWMVTEGRTEYGTDHVIEEWPELVTVVGSERGVAPHEGVRMLKIDARLCLKSNVRQFYRRPVTEGKLVQGIALNPYSEEYLQQFEVRGERDPDFRLLPIGVRGDQLFSLKYSHEKMLLVVTTCSEWRHGRHIIWKEFPPLPPMKWSLVKVVLEKVPPTQDGWGRTISQWRLSLYLNGELLYESGRPGESYIQYFQSADFHRR